MRLRLGAFAFLFSLGVFLMLLAPLTDLPPTKPFSEGVLVIAPDEATSRAFQQFLAAKFSSTDILPARFVGVYETRAEKSHRRRLLTVLVATRHDVRRFLPSVTLPAVLIGGGVPSSFAVTELGKWQEALHPFCHLPVVRLSAEKRAFKWMVLFAVDNLAPMTTFGQPAWLVLRPKVSTATVRRWVQETGVPLGVSLRVTPKAPRTFWLAWLGIALLCLGAHGLLWLCGRQKALMRPLGQEGGLYHVLAVLYFASYLLAAGVVYCHFDFYDALLIPPQLLPPLSVGDIVLGALVGNGVWVVITVMVPSAVVPPLGILIGLGRGMVSVLTTMPFSSSTVFVKDFLAALGVFWQGEATAVAMLWSALLTRALFAPTTFGTGNHWQAYKSALKAFFPLGILAWLFATLATFFGLLSSH